MTDDYEESFFVQRVKPEDNSSPVVFAKRIKGAFLEIAEDLEEFEDIDDINFDIDVTPEGEGYKVHCELSFKVVDWSFDVHDLSLSLLDEGFMYNVAEDKYKYTIIIE